MQHMVRTQIESYYKQLTKGCGHDTCTNKQCASSPNFLHREKTTNDLAACALRVSFFRKIIYGRFETIFNMILKLIKFALLCESL